MSEPGMGIPSWLSTIDLIIIIIIINYYYKVYALNSLFLPYNNNNHDNTVITWIFRNSYVVKYLYYQRISGMIKAVDMRMLA